MGQEGRRAVDGRLMVMSKRGDAFAPPVLPIPLAELLRHGWGEKRKKDEICLEGTDYCITFASEFDDGALDEWLSQRSAKPSTAVRIC